MREDFSEAERSEVSRKIDEAIPNNLAAPINKAISRGGDYWNTGKVECWKSGKMKNWNDGAMGSWEDTKWYSSKKLPRMPRILFRWQSEFISCLFYHSFLVKFKLSKVYDQ
ncbi:MAG: hypothetical protein PF486_11300 [Prolixibacteraceae bacterium]|nr:hypothetical protein [Prolixibacteraceae bacterium]